MDILTVIIALIMAGVAGAGVGYLAKKSSVKQKSEADQKDAEKTLNDANSKAKEILLEAKNEALKTLDQYKAEEEKKRQQLDKIESRLLDKEDLLEKKITQVDQTRGELEQKAEKIKVLRAEAELALENQQKELEKIAALSRDEAKALLIKEVEQSSRQDLAEHIRRAEAELKKESADKA